MECHYHPGRESTDECAICGKSICKECGLEIAKKVYCKDCLEKIIGLEMEDEETKPQVSQEPVQTEPADLSPQTDDNIYQPKNEEPDFEEPYTPQEASQEFGGISEDSPYNIRSNIEYSGGLESSYLDEPYQKEPEPQITQNENAPKEEEIPLQSDDVDYIYPDHDYEPQPTAASQNLEDKYARYLDDLYFDEPDVPLDEQLAKDEEQYGSLTRREYAPRKEEAVEQTIPGEKKAPRKETPEEMEARIRAEILKEQEEKANKKGLLKNRKKNKKEDLEPLDDIDLIGDEDKNIHNLNYQDEKEPMGIIDIILTIILIIVILIVVYYLIYLFLLSSTYPTFLDAVVALKNPQNVINQVLSLK